MTMTTAAVMMSCQPSANVVMLCSILKQTPMENSDAVVAIGMNFNRDCEDYL